MTNGQTQTIYEINKLNGIWIAEKYYNSFEKTKSALKSEKAFPSNEPVGLRVNSKARFLAIYHLITRSYFFLQIFIVAFNYLKIWFNCIPGKANKLKIMKVMPILGLTSGQFTYAAMGGRSTTILNSITEQ
jgi:hypothetical protein